MSKKQDLIDQAKEILAQYDGRITLRQLYYRLVATHKIDNNMKEYKRLVMAMSDARVKSRQIPFTAFEDKGRSFNGHYGRWTNTPDSVYESAEENFESAEEDFKASAGNFRLPAWHGQRVYVEVWCEKDALTNVFEPVCRRNSVVYGAAKGQPSLSWLYEASERIQSMSRRTDIDRVVILTYVDFDPAGLDIHKNIKRHINETFDLPNVEVIRMAITKEQIDEFDIPPMPTKPSDSRYSKWVAEHGDVSCVELDAIEPDDLAKIIKADIMSLWDKDAADKRKEEIKEGRDKVQSRIDEYFA
jgi:hypothetical protein